MGGQEGESIARGKGAVSERSLSLYYCYQERGGKGGELGRCAISPGKDASKCGRSREDYAVEMAARRGSAARNLGSGEREVWRVIDFFFIFLSGGGGGLGYNNFHARRKGTKKC